MSLIDPDVAHVAEFSEYPEILLAHRLAVNFDLEELFVGQKFKSKEECVFAIKRYSMNISVDYKVTVSKPTLYIRECWKSVEDYNWRMWVIRIFVGPHTCTSTRMTEDHQKLDSKTICTCIMAMVKDMLTIKVSVLIAKMQVSYLDTKNGSAISHPDGGGTLYAKVNLNIEQFFDDVYTLECTLRVWEKEFPILPDLSTWKVPLTTFELVPGRGLLRNSIGRPQSSKIRDKMDIREKSDGKCCGLCRLAGHN
ncbi:hypothetical protein PVK06_023050 [Gossypium arboreum]|uniref:Uncharacterized protein n=1 Tax=Gossypium arboreum TaxID=29729 RepID=A0ABR0PA10_GOSAR|nr:hypothetical protein PVK06_023050 [Gossypium arboreum]